MKTVWLVPALLLVTSCDSSQIRQCEAQLKNKLKSPASYKRVRVDQTSIGPEIHKPPYDEVTITYDAANAFNALLRDNETCFFVPGTTYAMANPYDQAASAQLDAVDMNATDMAATDTNETDAADTPGNAADNGYAEGVRELQNAIPENRRRWEAERAANGGETYTDGQPDSELANTTNDLGDDPDDPLNEYANTG